MRTLVGRFSTQCLEVATEQDLERLLGQPGRPATLHIQCWRWARDPWGARLGSGQGHRAGVWFCHLADTHRCGEDWVRSHCPSVGPQAVLLKGARVPCPPCERPCCSDLIPVPLLPRLCSSIMSQPPVLLHQDPHGAPSCPAVGSGTAVAASWAVSSARLGASVQSGRSGQGGARPAPASRRWKVLERRGWLLQSFSSAHWPLCPVGGNLTSWP